MVNEVPWRDEILKLGLDMSKINNSEKKKISRRTLKKVLQRIKNYWFFLALSILMAVVTVASTLYVPIVVGNAIDYIIGAGNVDFAAVRECLFKLAVVIAVTAVSQWIMSICNNKITYQVTRDIRDEAIEKIEHLPLSYIDGHSYGEVVSRVIADVDQFADGLLMGFTQFFTGVATILGTLIFMLMINVKITLVVVLITPVSFLVAGFIAKKTYSMFKLQSETRGEQTALIDEMIGGQKVVKAYSHEKEVVEQFDGINERLAKCSLNAIFFSSITNPATRFVNSLVYAGVAVTGALSVILGGAGAITVGQLVTFLSYANQYTKPFNEISGVITELQNALACADRVFELIEEKPEVAENVNAVSLSDYDGNVSLNNVNFSYTQDKKLIENFNLNVHKGQKIAIVGPTGCGKTTVINLLMRFYDVDSGSIKVSDIDIRDLTRHSLRAGYGMVLQDTWLKSGTIRENIIMGRPDATDEEIVEAAKASHAHSFIKRLPNGYDTVIGEDGGSLSQGQKQLLCITRVMLCRPPMLILDEATSSIDTRTEIKIQNAFNRLMEGRTSFIVAHRLSTIQSADVILVMKDGHIIEQGNHEELLAQGGFYRNLYESQFAQ
jgi:ATP-binding cassette subfamily B protein